MTAAFSWTAFSLRHLLFEAIFISVLAFEIKVIYASIPPQVFGQIQIQFFILVPYYGTQ
jgi:hypothetical protein